MNLFKRVITPRMLTTAECRTELTNEEYDVTPEISVVTSAMLFNFYLTNQTTKNEHQDSLCIFV